MMSFRPVAPAMTAVAFLLAAGCSTPLPTDVAAVNAAGTNGLSAVFARRPPAVRNLADYREGPSVTAITTCVSDVSGCVPQLTIYPSSVSQILGQTFTATANVALGFVGLPVLCDASGTMLRIQIRSGGLTGTVLSDDVVAIPATNEFGGIRTLRDFHAIPVGSGAGVSLRNGRVYGITMEAVAKTPSYSTYCNVPAGYADSGDWYTGGRGFSRPIGFSWTPVSSFDRTIGDDIPFIAWVK